MDDRRNGIGATTRLVCILGHPVGHSHSPQMHNAAFRAHHLDMVYLAFDVPDEMLPQAIAGLRALDAVGANVTIPHKEAVLPLLDKVDPMAARVGAVNTIVNDRGVLLGYNTDVEGFLAALEREWERGPRGATCLVFGAGGAARAVVAALASERAGEILIYARTRSRAQDLCGSVKSWSEVPCRVIEKSELRQAGNTADLLVNCTPVGMVGTVKLSPVPVDIVTGRHVVVDLVYGREPTALLQRAATEGAVAIDGTEMLVQQAARSYQLWTGKAAPIEVMRREVMLD